MFLSRVVNGLKTRKTSLNTLKQDATSSSLKTSIPSQAFLLHSRKCTLDASKVSRQTGTPRQHMFTQRRHDWFNPFLNATNSDPFIPAPTLSPVALETFLTAASLKATHDFNRHLEVRLSETPKYVIVEFQKHKPNLTTPLMDSMKMIVLPRRYTAEEWKELNSDERNAALRLRTAYLTRLVRPNFDTFILASEAYAKTHSIRMSSKTYIESIPIHDPKRRSELPSLMQLIQANKRLLKTIAQVEPDLHKSVPFNNILQHSRTLFIKYGHLDSPVPSPHEWHDMFAGPMETLVEKKDWQGALLFLTEMVIYNAHIDDHMYDKIVTGVAKVGLRDPSLNTHLYDRLKAIGELKIRPSLLTALKALAYQETAEAEINFIEKMLFPEPVQLDTERSLSMMDELTSLTWPNVPRFSSTSSNKMNEPL